jgi:Bifunctional DNA primase/polymerase, N-terminal
MLKRGFRLFPVKARGKQPLVTDWPHQATNDQELLKSWAERFPDCNWAVATGEESGIFVLDVDGESGLESIVELTNRHGAEWTKTLGVKTARGGHFYFRWPEGDRTIRNSAGKLAPGLALLPKQLKWRY